MPPGQTDRRARPSGPARTRPRPPRLHHLVRTPAPPGPHAARSSKPPPLPLFSFRCSFPREEPPSLALRRRSAERKPPPLLRRENRPHSPFIFVAAPPPRTPPHPRALHLPLRVLRFSALHLPLFGFLDLGFERRRVEALKFESAAFYPDVSHPPFPIPT